MESLINMLAQVNFLHLLWIFLIIAAIHELEEWNIDQFERRHFSGLPPAATDKSARMVIAYVIAIGLLWVSAAALTGSPATAAWIIMPAVAFMIMNALQHIFWTIYFRQLAPGVISSIILVIPYGLYLIAEALRQGYIPVWYVAILAAIFGAGLVQTIISGSRMPPLIRAANQLGIVIARVF